MSWDVFSNSKQHDLAGLPWPHVYIWHLENVMRGRDLKTRERRRPLPPELEEGASGRRLVGAAAEATDVCLPQAGVRPARCVLRTGHLRPPAGHTPAAEGGSQSRSRRRLCREAVLILRSAVDEKTNQ